MNKYILLVELMQILAGAPVEDQLRRLPKWVEEKFHYALECDRNWVWGTSDNQCLQGMLRFTRAVIEEESPTPNEKIRVRIMTKGWGRMDVEQVHPRISLPYRAPRSEIASFLKEELSKPDYRQRLEFLEEIGDMLDALKDKTGVEFEVDDSVTNVHAVAALYKLQLLAEENAAMFKAKAEVIRLGTNFEFPFEQNLRLKETIDVEAPLSQIRFFFASPRRFLGEADALFARRGLVDKLRTDLASTGTFGQVVCSPLGVMTYNACEVMIRRMQQLIDRKQITFPRADILVIAAINEVPVSVDYFQDPPTGKTLMMVRTGTKIPALIRQFGSKNWIQKIPSPGGTP